MNNELKFSASASKRWLKCTGSVRAIASLGNPYRSNVYAEAGKELHNEAAIKLFNNFLPLSQLTDLNVHLNMGHYVQPPEENAFTDNEIVDSYVQYVSSFAHKNMDIYIEQKINFKGWTPALYHGNGYADCIIVDRDKKEVHIFDFKTGNTNVEAQDNSQLALYALGTYKDILKHDDSYKTYYLHIAQPSIANLTCCKYTLDELLKFGDYIKQQAQKAVERPEFTPSQDGCSYCDYKGHCKALKIYADKIFKMIDKNQLTHADRFEIIKNKKLISSFIDEVETETSKLMQSGEKVDGLKLVRGITRRKWKDEIEASEELMKYLNDEQLYCKKLISVTEASKLLKESFSNIENYLIKPEGKLQCALISDRRKAVGIASVVDWFDIID